MTNKLSDAFYEGFCTAICGDESASIFERGVDVAELKEFISRNTKFEHLLERIMYE